ncbi:O-antigen ligase family protein [Sinomicrobium kalidii]|uniref:O-antigen ligase family protein n=1 Tax=Sinomicrobium kalidii TaxID=2900738 RepID=UPI001E4E2162|nr:O-antigen ligase family protein [Sinomicrobium kalidii]UGU17990.1 O-antigen ligase family protein [Sinomicrobium kalidii]
MLGELSASEIKRNNLSSLEHINKETVSKIKLRRFRNFVIKLVDTHTTYQGWWVSFVLFVILKKVFVGTKIRFVRKTLLLLLGVLLFVWLLLLSARMPLFAFFAASFLALLFFNTLKIRTYIFVAIAFFSIALSSYLIFPPLKIRIDEILATKFELPSDGNDIETYNSINVRNGVYYCSFEVIRKNFLFGVGIGDSQEELNTCYRDKIGAKIYTWTTYNSHNQFLFFMVASGAIGLIFYLVSLCLQVRMSIGYKENLYFFFLITTILISITENILARSDGVIFFSFFNALFLFNSKYLQK